jgi:hypothetical protein
MIYESHLEGKIREKERKGKGEKVLNSCAFRAT